MSSRESVVAARQAPIAQLAEAADLKSAQCGFESHWGHILPLPVNAGRGFFYLITSVVRLPSLGIVFSPGGIESI